MSAERATIVEVGPRDGLQNEARTVPTAEKVRFVELLADAGLPVVEVTSFVSPRAVPQLADADAVLPAVHRRKGVRYPVLVPNARGLERAEAAGADAIAVFTAASEGFARANVNMTIAESLAAFGPVLERALEAGMWTRGYVSTAFGCPYDGAVAPEAVARVARELAALGCDEISIGDTIGVARPEQVPEVVAAVTGHVPVERMALHLHDTGGRALENVAAGLGAGVRIFDSSAAGLGGCPFAPGAPGNVATEALVRFLEREGLETGVDPDAVERGRAHGARPPRRMIHESVYVPGEGGTRIAVDAWAPAGGRLPAVPRAAPLLAWSRPALAVRARWAAAGCGGRPHAGGRTRRGRHRRPRRRGVVRRPARRVAARGGRRRGRRAGLDRLAAVVGRPRAAVGISYGGTAALLLAARGHPALRAVAARFCFWDLADDLVLPGGVRNTWLAERWTERVAALDRGRLPIGGPRARLAVRGPRAVAGSRRDLRAALAEHGSHGSAEHGRAVTAEQLRARAPSSALAAIRESGIAVHSLGGWYDGAATRAAVEIHRALGGELVLGPWDHGGYHDVSPHHASGEMRFDIAGEVLGFLDRAFGTPAAVAVAPVRYHVVGAERWRTAPAWPPPGTARLALCLDAVGALSAAPPATGADDHELDLAASSGERTRWRSQLQPAPPTSYAGRAPLACSYTSAPFPDGLEIAGEPVCLLMLEAGAGRANLFCYLDEIAPDGSATYVTEGCSAAGGPWPSTVRVELQPIACRIEPGSALRLSFAPVDGEVFEPPPAGGSRVRLLRGGPEPSRLELPVVHAADLLKVASRMPMFR